MAAGQSKIELILELQNRISTGLTQAKSQIDSQIGGMQSRLAEFTSNTKKGFQDFGKELPIIGSGLGGLVNPATLAAAGVGLLTTGFIKATNRAAEFNHEFRDLANLNLDKTQGELLELRKLVMDTAWKKKFGAEETSSAYNEVQSTIGLYGKEAQAIVEKQGEFAKVMNANMGDYVAGTSKAMANWRFGVDRLDEFNKSAYATMQVGVVSFEQLSKVQSVYAGAAASVKQDFDTANKLFSLFTIKTKSVDEAATLTKSLFNELTKKTTIDAFAKIGINFYKANGQLKQADTIMLELNKKFMQMDSDKSIVALKNQFKGSEGLIAMIQAATDRSGELKNTFDEFSNSKMNFDSAMNNAQNDIIYRQEQLANRVDNLVIRMGQMMLPLKEWVIGLGETFVDKINTLTKTPQERIDFVRETEQENVQKKYGHLIANVANLTQEEYNKTLGALQYDVDKYKKLFDDKSHNYATVSWLQGSHLPFATQGEKLEYYDAKTGYGRHADLARSKAMQSLLYKIEDAWTNKDKEDDSNSLSGKTTDNSGLSSLTESLNKVVGSAQAPRNITVNIDAFNKGGINTQNTSLQKMDADQIDNWFTDLCMRAIRNVEMSY